MCGFAYIHCYATDVFSVLWSYPRLYNEKTTIINSSNIRGLNLGAVKHTTVQVTRQLL
jgi:hypothetical protein